MDDVKLYVRVSTIVATNPAESFEIFTRETARWWAARSAVSHFARRSRAAFGSNPAAAGECSRSVPAARASEIRNDPGVAARGALDFDWRSERFDSRPGVRRSR